MNYKTNIDDAMPPRGDGSVARILKKLGENKNIKVASKLDDFTPEGAFLEFNSNFKQAYREAVEKGYKGTEDDFIKEIPLDQLRQLFGKGGNVVLISDYLKQKEEPKIKKINLAQNDFEKTVAELTDKDRETIRQLLKMSGIKVSD